MLTSINFVRERRKRLTESGLRDLEFFKISAIVTGAVLAIFLVSLGVRLFLINQLQQIKTEQQRYQRLVVSQDEIEKSYIIFTNKLRTLTEIFKQRRNKQAALSYFSYVFGPEVVIERIAYDAKSDLLAFGLKTNDIFELEKVTAILESEETKRQFASLTTSRLVRAVSGEYQMQVTLVLKNGESQQ